MVYPPDEVFLSEWWSFGNVKVAKIMYLITRITYVFLFLFILSRLSPYSLRSTVIGAGLIKIYCNSCSVSEIVLFFRRL